MATAPLDALCVAYGFLSSIAASKVCVFNNFTAKRILQEAILIIRVSFDIMKTRKKTVKRVTLRLVRNCEFKAGTKYAASLKIPQ
jgi:hypothetical protein